MVETDLNSIAIDINGNVWVGSNSPNGIIQIYNYKEFKSVKVFDFEIWETSSIVTKDSVAFVSYSNDGEWGILEFFLDKNNIYNYRQIYNPSGDQLDFIYDIEILNNELYVATNLGLFNGNFNDFILNYPNNWTSRSCLYIL